MYISLRNSVSRKRTSLVVGQAAYWGQVTLTWWVKGRAVSSWIVVWLYIVAWIVGGSLTVAIVTSSRVSATVVVPVIHEVFVLAEAITI